MWQRAFAWGLWLFLAVVLMEVTSRYQSLFITVVLITVGVPFYAWVALPLRDIANAEQADVAEGAD